MRQPYIERNTVQTNAGSTVEFKLPAVKPGQLLRVRQASVTNLSGESVQWTFGLLESSDYQPFDGAQNSSNNQGKAVLYDWWVREGQVLAFHVAGTALKGRVICTVSGDLYDMDAVDVVVVKQLPAPPAPAGG